MITRRTALVLPVLASAYSLASAENRILVDMLLICMVDVSGSVQNDEYEKQRNGYVQALRDPEVIAAIQSRGTVAIVYVEWSGSTPIYAEAQRTVAWGIVRDSETGEKLAQQIADSPRLDSRGGTALFEALALGVTIVRKGYYVSERNVIDISGDGPDNTNIPDRLRKNFPADITVNGLPIIDTDSPDLEKYYRTQVVRGPGSFVEVAHGFDEFADAIKRKLIKEIGNNIS